MTTTTGSRRGRPRAGERAEREQRIVSAALAELIEHGYDQVTMSAIAARAGASKETLYNWFGSKEGLFAALIEANADQSARRVEDALDADADARDTLVAYATGLLTLLTSAGSIALNRAAMSSPELAEVLLVNGRHRVGPLVETYLTRLDDAGVIAVDEPGTAFELLYGLVVRDAQIRVLLGEAPPSPAAVAERAATAVDQFLRLTQPGRNRR